MADEITPTVTPVTAPAVEATPAAVVAPAPVVENTPAAQIETPVEPKSATVLGEALEKTEVTAPVVETTPTVTENKELTPDNGETKTSEGQTEEPASPPVYDAFSLPENVKLDDGRVKEFTNILAELETKSKVDHTLMQEFGQKAVDFHIAEVSKAVNDLTELYKTTWERQKLQWKDTFLKDPEIGGNRFQTTVDSALNFIRTHGGTAEQQAEFRNLMETSGLGNHPAMIRLLANAGKVMSEGKPLATVKPVSAPKSKTAILYGSSS